MEGNVLVRKSGMYSRVPIPLVRNKEISNQAKIVYMQLASHSDGWVIYVKKLAEDCQMTETTLRRYVTELERHGYVVRERIKKDGLLKGYNWELVEYPNQPKRQELELDQAKQTEQSQKENVKKTNAEQLQEDFEKLWELYPNKKGKTAAFKAYKRAIKDGTTNKEIQTGIVAYKKQIAINHTEKQYIKHGGTFFNQRCWEDEDLKEIVTTPKQQETNGNFSDIDPMNMQDMFKNRF